MSLKGITIVGRTRSEPNTNQT